MKITKSQLRRIIREASMSFDQADDHYVGGVRMTGPGADNVFGKRKSDDRSIENKIMSMSGEQHRDLIAFVIEKAQHTLGLGGIEEAISSAFDKIK